MTALQRLLLVPNASHPSPCPPSPTAPRDWLYVQSPARSVFGGLVGVKACTDVPTIPTRSGALLPVPTPGVDRKLRREAFQAGTVRTARLLALGQRCGHPRNRNNGCHSQTSKDLLHVTVPPVTVGARGHWWYRWSS